MKVVSTKSHCVSAEDQGFPGLSFFPKSWDCPCFLRAGCCPNPVQAGHLHSLMRVQPWALEHPLVASGPLFEVGGFLGPSVLGAGGVGCADGEGASGPGCERLLSDTPGEPEQCFSDPGGQLV